MGHDLSKLTQEQLKELVQNQGRTNAEVAAANSEQNVSKIADDFVKRTGFQKSPNDPWAERDIVDMAKARHGFVTADALVEAYEIRQASRLPQQDLKRVIQERERG